jgi:hypothetical protein
MRRRSLEVLPPQTPYLWSVAIAQARHCFLTGQVEQMSLARLLNRSDSGKKTSESALRHAAKLRHSSPPEIQLAIMYKSARRTSLRYASIEVAVTLDPPDALIGQGILGG